MDKGSFCMMSFNNHKILEVWEKTQRLRPPDRALTILYAAFPEKTREELASMSVGKRNFLLLDVREKTFGGNLQGALKCYKCKKPLEFTAQTDELRGPDFLKDDTETFHSIKFKDAELEIRALNSFDLAMAADSRSGLYSTRDMLAKLCVNKVFILGKQADVNSLPDEVLDQISFKLKEIDPGAVMKIELKCPECKSDLLIPFDISDFFWKEIQSQAKRLMKEVHILAAAYRWREKDILDMSAVRRNYYLDIAER